MLIKLGLVSSRFYYKNLILFNLVCKNKLPVTFKNTNISIGDIITLPLITLPISKTDLVSKLKKKKKLKKTQRIQHVITKSQWRQHKLTKPRIFKFFQQFKYSAIPN